LQQFRLPLDVFLVIEGIRGRRRLCRQASLLRIQLVQFLEEHVERPAVDGDVMDGNQEDRRVERPQQTHPEYWSVLEVEWAVRFIGDPTSRLRLIPAAAVDLLEVQLPGIGDALAGLAVPVQEVGCSERGMSRHDPLERAAEDPAVKAGGARY